MRRRGSETLGQVSGAGVLHGALQQQRQHRDCHVRVDAVWRPVQQGRPRHDGIHRIQEVLALGAPTKPLESRTLICRHRQCLLLHRQAFRELLRLVRSNRRARGLDQGCLNFTVSQE